MSRPSEGRASRAHVSSNGERGQLVLVSGAVVVVALFAVVLVHAQLASVGGAETPSITGVSTATEDAVEEAAAGVAGRYDWPARDAAISDFRSRLNPSLVEIERAHTGSGGVSLTTNGSVADGWALRNCPHDAYRDFGPCVADDGVVMQERAGETTFVAVAVDVRLGTPQSRTDLTIVVRPV